MRLEDRTDLACRTPGVDPDLFFPQYPWQLEAARAVCASCPASGACLTFAVDKGTSDGVWGGVWFDRGLIRERLRRRGRPRIVR